jgi:hypothetical protein
MHEEIMEIIYINLIRNYLYGTFLRLININPLTIKRAPPKRIIQLFIGSRNARLIKFGVKPMLIKYKPIRRFTKNKMPLNLAITKNKKQTF